MTEIFVLLILLYSVIIHEVSHGWAALKLGDDTAEKMGRLTLNPLPHLDLFGSILLPLILALTRSPILFGWAKPVPYNPLKLKHPARDSALLALAGPTSNLILAFIFGIFIRFSHYFTAFQSLNPFFLIIVQVNLVLAIFNLVPLPPLDGSKILFYFWPNAKLEIFLEKYSFLILLLFLMFGWGLISPVISGLQFLFTGIP